MEETTYLNDSGILVTSSRIEMSGQTFAVRNVGSVKITRKGFSYVGALLMLIGLVTLMPNPFLGVPLGLLGAALIWNNMTQRTLVLVTGGGEVSAYQSRNATQMENVRTAVANAIAAR